MIFEVLRGSGVRRTESSLRRHCCFLTRVEHAKNVVALQYGQLDGKTGVDHRH